MLKNAESRNVKESKKIFLDLHQHLMGSSLIHTETLH